MSSPKTTLSHLFSSSFLLFFDNEVKLRRHIQIIYTFGSEIVYVAFYQPFEPERPVYRPNVEAIEGGQGYRVI